MFVEQFFCHFCLVRPGDEKAIKYHEGGAQARIVSWHKDSP
jgi:hypothetical protein